MFGKIAIAAASLSLLGATTPATPIERPGASKDIAAACGTREGWSDPAPPAHIFGNTWYVGTCGITVVLIETKAGLVLIDTGPEEAAPQVLANISTLGFDPRKIKWLLMTHEHFDHVGGMAAMQRATGAKLAVGPFAAAAMRSGKPDPRDPQAALLEKHPMGPARVDRVLHDGATLAVGGTRFTIHVTPTHSPGSTSWTWQSCEAHTCQNIAYADSISTISSDDYRFTAHIDRFNDARKGLEAISNLPCDILITPHPSGSNLLPRLSGKAPLTSLTMTCQGYAIVGHDRLMKRIEQEMPPK